MNRTANSHSKIGPKLSLAVTTALAAGLLTGCASLSAPRADLAAGKAEAALANGKTAKAVEQAEAAVLADPRNPAYRATLGAAYLDAGRFASAETTFGDAMKLGDNSPRTALSLVLALDGEGKYPQAIALLDQWQDRIAAADLGLAYALSGRPDRGIATMGAAIRSGDSTPKIRQNLAYAYALAGQWREARLMASQDLSGNLVDSRMEHWAEMVQPQAWQARVATLIGAPTGVADAGQPAQLALANTPSVQQLAAEAVAPPALKSDTAVAASTAATPAAKPAAPASTELPAVAAVAPIAVPLSQPAQKSAAPDDFKAAFATIVPSAPATPSAAPVKHEATRFVSSPVVEALSEGPKARHAIAAKPVPAVAAKEASGTHLVQLGSFGSADAARRAWSVYTKHYPELAGHQMVISEAVVRGKHYWRVAAAGYSVASSQALCGRVKNAGQGCIAYAEGHPLPGALDADLRVAVR